MPTTSRQSELLIRCDRAREDLGLSCVDYGRLARFNPTYPYNYNPDTGARSKPIQDRYSKYLKECENILDKYNPNKLEATLKLYIQGDPRGCHVWIYKASDDPEGRVDCIYNSIGTACYE
jgi:hypothetical protein